MGASSLSKRRLTNKEQIKLDKLKVGLSMDIAEVIDIKNNNVTEESETEIERSMRKGDYMFKFHRKCRVYDDNALFCLKGKYKIRKALVWLIEWPYFENFILFCIFLNSISLAIFDYNDRSSLTTRNMILEQAGLVFNVIFTFECVAKITAIGFILHRKAYLRDAFNVIDFVVVISGLLEFVNFGSSSLTTLRILRILRPLRSINALPKMRNLVTTLINSMPKFFNVAAFIFFIFGLFSILGMHSFSGTVYYHCRTTEKPLNATYWPKTVDNRVCGIGEGLNQCEKNQFCGAPAQFGISLEDDRVGDNANILYGIATFDNIFTSLLSVFQSITLDSWTVHLYNMTNGYFIYFPPIFFILLIVLGSFFLLNLILAVIMDAFTSLSNPLDDKIEDGVGSTNPNQDKESVKDSFNTDEEFKEVSEQNDGEEEDLQHSKTINPLAFQRPISIKQSSLGQIQLLKGMSVDQYTKVTKSILKSPRKIPEAIEQSSSSQGISQHTFDGNGQDETVLPHTVRGYNTERENLVDNKVFLSGGEFEGEQVDLSEAEDFVNGNHLTPHVKPPRLQHFQSDNNYQIPKIKIISSQGTITHANCSIKSSNSQVSDASSKRTSKLNKFKTAEQEVKISPLHINLMSKPQQRSIGSSKRSSFMQEASKEEVEERVLEFRVGKLKEGVNGMYKKKFLHVRSKQRIIFDLFYKLAEHWAFQSFISLCIIANTVVLSLDKYPISDSEEQTLEGVNLFFTCVFIAEMFIKLIGFGIKSYFKDSFNTFDCIIVITSIIDIVLTFADLNISAAGAISALRAFRLLRVFKLAKSWRKFRYLLKTIGQTFQDISTFSILLFLFIFTYTILGMETFAYKAKIDDSGKLDPEGSSPEYNFDYFLQSFTSVFIVIANDGWSTIFFTYYRAVGDYQALIFFLSLLVIGQFILFNLFLAILLQNFDDDSRDMEYLKIKENDEAKEAEEQGRQVTKQETVLQQMKNWVLKKMGKKTKAQQEMEKEEITVDMQKVKKKRNAFLNKIFKQMQKEREQELIKDNQKQMEGTSLYIFKVENTFRRVIYQLVNKTWFDYIILLAILISTIQLAIENPRMNPNSLLATVLYYLDLTLTIIFIIEALVKIIAFGFLFNGNESYLRSPWNIMDFVIVGFSVVSLSNQGGSYLKAFKAIRLLRVLRPLRVIARNEGLKIAVSSLLLASSDIANMTFIALLFFLIFGIIGVNLFKGQFYDCQVQEFKMEDDLPLETKWDCLNLGGEWERLMFHFDSILPAMTTMVHMASTVGWAAVMYQGASTRGIDKTLKSKSNPNIQIFFIVFMIVGSFFILNLFVGIVISTFNREKDRLGKAFLLSKEQKEWLDMRLLMNRSQPKKIHRVKSNNVFRKFFFNIQDSRRFEFFIIGCITLNTLILCIKYYEQPDSVTLATEYLNLFFAFIFTLEAVIKLIALGREYFKESWNIFDFSIVIGTIASIILSYTTDITIGSTTTLIRSFRIFRVFRLIRSAKSLRLMFTTFIVTLPALINVGGLLVLLLYLYSILGVNLFANVKRSYPLTEQVNFESFQNAFITLFRASTGEAWHEIMYAVGRQKSILFKCQNDFTYDDFIKNGREAGGCGESLSAFFFFSYFLLIQLIFLNLFIAIILQGFSATNARENQQFNNETSELFSESWAKFDPDATSLIPKEKLLDLLYDLGAPLGMTEKEFGPLDPSKLLDRETMEEREEFIKSLKLSLFNDFKNYQYMDVLTKLSRKLLERQVVFKSLTMKLGMEEEVLNKLKIQLHDLEENEDDIQDVKRIQAIEKKEKEKQQQFEVVTAEQIAACKILVKNLRIMIKNRKEREAKEEKQRKREEKRRIQEEIIKIEEEQKRKKKEQETEMKRITLIAKIEEEAQKESFNSNFTKSDFDEKFPKDLIDDKIRIEPSFESDNLQKNPVILSKVEPKLPPMTMSLNQIPRVPEEEIINLKTQRYNPIAQLQQEEDERNNYSLNDSYRKNVQEKKKQNQNLLGDTLGSQRMGSVEEEEEEEKEVNISSLPHPLNQEEERQSSQPRSPSSQATQDLPQKDPFVPNLNMEAMQAGGVLSQDTFSSAYETKRELLQNQNEIQTINRIRKEMKQSQSTTLKKKPKRTNLNRSRKAYAEQLKDLKREKEEKLKKLDLTKLEQQINDIIETQQEEAEEE